MFNTFEPNIYINYQYVKQDYKEVN
jgi:hypothetical protein